MDKDVFWLRISFWVGAISDAVVGMAMLCPWLIGKAYGLDNFNPGSEYMYAMGMGAALMFGWTVLLIWADRKPLQRKGILIITVFPVIIGLMAAEAYAVKSGFISLGEMAPSWIYQAFLIWLFSYSYFRARKYGA
ncbi:MAG: hypothetical protein GY839_08410 [candidate division Zixibacteria bacterium]|nr:hypothetical protein [candidate division Zixibacteria bacterium]